MRERSQKCGSQRPPVYLLRGGGCGGRRRFPARVVQFFEKRCNSLADFCLCGYFLVDFARGVAKMLVSGLPSLAAKDGHGRATGNSSPGKNWLLQLKLLCGIAIFWPWAARGLSGSFENVIEFQKKCTTLVVRLVFAD